MKQEHCHSLHEAGISGAGSRSDHYRGTLKDTFFFRKILIKAMRLKLFLCPSITRHLKVVFSLSPLSDRNLKKYKGESFCLACPAALGSGSSGGERPGQRLGPGPLPAHAQQA